MSVTSSTSRRCECGKPAHPDRDGQCYRCSVAGIAFTFRGPIMTRAGWNQHTLGSFHRENFGVDSGAELARTNDNIEPYTGG